jgi:hypothetical protein
VVGTHHELAAPGGRGQQPVERGAGAVVEAAGRLVEDHDVGLADQRRRERHALALAVRQGVERPIEWGVEGARHVLAGVCLAADPRELAQPRAPGRSRDGREALGGVAGPQPLGAHDAPARGRRDPGHEPQQRRLADAVGAAHRDERARLELEVDTLQDRRAQAVSLGDLLECDQNAPRRDSTAGTVLTRIERSRKTDQRSR